MKSFFDKNGYTVTDLFSSNEIQMYVEQLKKVLYMQCIKMSIEYSDDIFITVKKLQEIYPKVIDEAFQILRNSTEGHLLSSNKTLKSISNNLLNREENDLLVVSGPSFFINFPNENTRKYTWHSEQNWYPKRRNFLNVWCPIINDRVDNNSMELKVGTHEKDWFYFSEYSGYNGKIDPSSNVQYEIPEKLISKYQSVIPKVKIGEAIFFDGKSVHRSLDNTSDKPYFTIVFRVFDYSNDLTLSSNWADIPYNRQSIGYPNINVE
jgi:hypothetical protein